MNEALFARRTVVFAPGQLYGNEPLLGPFVQRCIELATPQVVLKGKSRAIVQLRNRSVTALQLKFPNAAGGIKAPSQVDLPPGTVTAVDFTRAEKSPPGTRTVSLPCLVTNAFVAPGQPLQIELQVPVRVEP